MSRRSASSLELAFMSLWEIYGTPYVLMPEHRFAPSRNAVLPAPLQRYAGRAWRVDFAHVESRVAIELEGGVWTSGRHTRGTGYIADIDKYNALTSLGWALLRYTRTHLNDPEHVISEIVALIASRLDATSFGQVIGSG